ncbi:cupin domain-containing protein [Aspergillus puulaauensis]|uniref:Cupin 2 conserved barrel domain-containing protein n=1 Tax=Aspergillus puulaauensis TaxID=1220207 RepID=A0A7R8ARC9_9EURO|nr:uncharacterized protein APUU_51479S [Aspergillus puulaauensis]BCS26768.1 hypothetical protein APUU_51479S [Aspergillus puulaauensis]
MDKYGDHQRPNAGYMRSRVCPSGQSDSMLLTSSGHVRICPAQTYKVADQGFTFVADGTTQKKGPTFTGEVWYDSVLNKQEEGITMVTATFTPCARTHWHHHEDGQVLEVKAGSGWVCDKGGIPQKLAVGDIVWCPAGTTHWHGADKGSILVHLAISRGKTTWFEPVTEEEYGVRLEGCLKQ